MKSILTMSVGLTASLLLVSAYADGTAREYTVYNCTDSSIKVNINSSSPGTQNGTASSYTGTQKITDSGNASMYEKCPYWSGTAMGSQEYGDTILVTLSKNSSNRMVSTNSAGCKYVILPSGSMMLLPGEPANCSN